MKFGAENIGRINIGKFLTRPVLDLKYIHIQRLRVITEVHFLTKIGIVSVRGEA